MNNFVKRNNEIHALIEVHPICHKWLFFTIYASSVTSNRNIMWDNISNIFYNYKDAWLLGGDLNDMLVANGKWGGNPINKRRAAKILSKINYCKLMI